MEEEQTAGTTEAQGGDAAVTQTTGTETEAGRDAGTQSDTERLNLAWKVNAEANARRAAELEAENAELRSRQQLPAAERDDLDPRQRRRQAVRYWANEKNDPVAAEVLSMRDEIREELANELLRQEHERQLDRITDEAKRDQVKKLFDRDRHLYGSPSVALEVIESRERAVEVERLRKQLEGRQQQKKDELKEAVPTHAKGEPKEAKTEVTKMTFAEFDTQVDALRAEGREKEVMELQGRARMGKIDLTR